MVQFRVDGTRGMGVRTSGVASEAKAAGRRGVTAPRGRRNSCVAQDACTAAQAQKLQKL